jgi:hypothetical protein
LAEYKEHEADRIERMLDGQKRIAVVRRNGYRDGVWQTRWECLRCGRGGMWMTPYYGNWPGPSHIEYALTKHRCSPVETDRI